MAELDDATMSLRRDMIEMIGGCWQTQVVGAAVRLCVPDALGPAGAPVEEIAGVVGCPPATLRRLLRAMCSLDLARQIDHVLFASTPAGDLLRADAPQGYRGLALSWTDRLWKAWSALEQGVRTGEPTVPSGQDGFASMASRPDQAAVLNQSQADRSRGAAREAARVFDFSRFRTIIDVGGGYGAVLAAALGAHPTVRGSVFDLPYIEEMTLRFQAAEGVADRAGFIGGSFFDGVPAGADCYVLKSILHDWPDEACRTILVNCARAAGPGGAILIIEQVLPELATADPRHRSAFRTDLTMLLGTGGLERTEAEFRILLADAGITLERLISNESEFTVLEGRVVGAA